ARSPLARSSTHVRASRQLGQLVVLQKINVRTEPSARRQFLEYLAQKFVGPQKIIASDFPVRQQLARERDLLEHPPRKTRGTGLTKLLDKLPAHLFETLAGVHLGGHIETSRRLTGGDGTQLAERFPPAWSR